MDAEGVPELIYDQSLGIYYPAVTDYYGYYYTGPEPSLSEWDSHHQFFGQDPHVSAVQAEGLPNVYYIPSYGYVQSPYNPYNPSIPGAVMGTEASFIEPHYPANHPPHQLVVSSPAYIPVGFDSSSDTVPNTYINPLFASTGGLPAMKPDGEIKKLAPPLGPQLAAMNRSQASLAVASDHLASNNTLQSSSSRSHTISIPREASVANSAPAKQPSVGSFINGSIHGVNQGANQLSNLKVPSVHRPAKATIPPSNGYANYGSDLNQWTPGNHGDRFRPRFQPGGPWVNRNGNLPEQNRGPRTDSAKYHWVSPLSVKAYTTKAGNVDAEGNIIISSDQFNRDDFFIDYEFAKFFVIKSYSEDDVHKSIKYSVWSSTPSGNKRLDNAFEEAQKFSLGRSQKCPVFLFFSVNASGQFCGVAEMTGSVDFQKDMDFWQQDKWLGSFPVKWHVIKDVSNTSLRHILLENNEYKPVTCSRDTQEIPFLQGMAMLRIFKAASLQTSILDDLLIYEERQRILFEEKSRISGRRHSAQFFPPPFLPSSNRSESVADKDTTIAATSSTSTAAAAAATAATAAAVATESAEIEASSTTDGEPQPAESVERETPPDENGSSAANGDDSKPSKGAQSPSKATNLVILGHSQEQFDEGADSIMKVGSLLIDSKAGEDLPSSSQNDVITVGSMHIKVGKHASPR